MENHPSVEEIKKKIEEGNDPTALTEYSFDAVTYAILENASMESIDYLLSIKGNEINKNTHDGRNYLMWAAYKGNVELVKDLLRRGSDINIVDDHGYGVITFAAAGGNKEPDLYNTLLKGGAKIDETDHDGANALHILAPHIENLSDLEYFVNKGLNIKGKDAEGNTMFNYAATKGNIPIMNQLIAKGVDHKTLNEEGGNAVIFASYGARGHTNDLKVFEYLENLGLQMNVVTKKGISPLHYLVCGTKDIALIDYFTKKGVDVNQKDEDGNTAFLNAVNWDNLKIATYLLPKVDNLNHQNKNGYSALTYSLINKQKDFFDPLISKGADAQITDKEGNSLAFHALKGYNDEKSAHFIKVLERKKRSILPKPKEKATPYTIWP